MAPLNNRKAVVGRMQSVSQSEVGAARISSANFIGTHSIGKFTPLLVDACNLASEPFEYPGLAMWSWDNKVPCRINDPNSGMVWITNGSKDLSVLPKLATLLQPDISTSKTRTS